MQHSALGEAAAEHALQALPREQLSQTGEEALLCVLRSLLLVSDQKCLPQTSCKARQALFRQHKAS